MEPRIQYAKTSDGVSIAYWTLGEGPPVVWMQAPPFSHIQLEWELPLYRRTFVKLARGRQLVRYDPRGCGLSEGDVANFSLDAHLLDLEAVVAKLRPERLALVAITDAGPIAISYAARNPHRITHLVLWGSYARGGFEDASQIQALHALMDRDWVFFTETAAHAMFGWSAGEEARSAAQFLAQCTTRDAVKVVWDASAKIDVTEVLSAVLCPTLVLHPSHMRWVDIDQSRVLASRIPQARLTVLEDLSGVLQSDEAGATVTAIDEFLTEGEPSEPAATASPPGAFRTVLFTDLVGHSEMMSRLGDERGRAVLREHERITREVLKQHGGTEVKTMGDGFMASFGSVTKAVECAVALQRAMEGALTPDPSPAAGEGQHLEPLKIRCGLNAGEPIEEEGDLFGATVILAARIAAKAGGGEILVANAVRELCAGKGFLFSDRGDFVAKGFEEPVRVYEVRWRA